MKDGLAGFAEAMAHCAAAGAAWPGAVAVSGGSDSVALMRLLKEWARREDVAPPVVLTVDHGLQSGSRSIARHVMKAAEELELRAHVLTWRGQKPRADIEAAARDARYGLLGRWCRKNKIRGLYLAHTRDDQAETFLLRLARGSGVDGLAAMRPVAPFPLSDLAELRVVRPLLGVSRAALRTYLQGCGASWSEDPMNADPRFARVRLRAAWPALEQAGLSAARIAGAAAHLARARDALEAATTQFLDEACHFDEGRIVVDGRRLATAPAEIGLRALAHILARVSGTFYRPRFARLERLYEAIQGGHFKSARTLQGCRIGPAPRSIAAFGADSLVVTRERGRGKRSSAPDVAAPGQIS